MKNTLASLMVFLSLIVTAQKASVSTANALDTALVHRVTGVQGAWNNGEYKITIPQNQLTVIVDSFRIIPAMGLSSWVGFTPFKDGAMIMGDLVLTENDLKPVQQEVIRQGLMITAIHNHFVRNHPNVLYMHIGGSGKPELLSAKVKAVLDKVAQSRGGQPSEGSPETVANSIDTAMLNNIVGKSGQMNNGVYKQTISRPDVQLKEHVIPVSSFMGFNTWAAWQGTMEHAAVAGDFAMLEAEVQPVLSTLVSNGIEVVAVHNHMVHEEPKIFFLHYWGVGDARTLATALRLALDHTGKASQSSMKSMH